MSCFKKVLLLLAIIGGINWGIYGIWGFNAVGWLLGGSICVGIFAALFMQCVINLGMNLQVLPVIGVTLPFFSAGGSSVVMMYLCIGIVLSVGMNTRRSKLDMQRII